MNLKDSLECQMACSKCFMAVLVPFLVCSAFVGCGFLLPLLFTLFFVILSSTFFTFSKHKQMHLETPMESKLEPESETITQQKDSQEGEVVSQVDLDGHMVRSLDSFSESESIDQQSSTTDQDSQEEQEEDSPDCSDESISDEESLIEIALPSGHYVGGGTKKEEPKLFNLQQKFPDSSLMEILADINEMNEEDNLIEIDISMGSIKCSRFEIET